MIESHAHYDDSRFDEDRTELLSSLPANGIEYVINVGADMQSSERSIKLAEQFPFVFAAVGVHPHEAEQMTDADFDVLRTYAKHNKVVAIGEIGLDYYYDHSPREIQRQRFVEQLALAHELQLPVIIHSRDACAETMDIIKNSKVRNGVIHCFSGSVETAVEYVNMGFHIGVGGVVTYKNAKKLVDTVREIPIERLLIETDCPYLTPVPHRGERNSSLYLKYIVDKISEIKNISPESIEKSTKTNTLALFVKIFIA